MKWTTIKENGKARTLDLDSENTTLLDIFGEAVLMFCERKKK